MFCGIASVTTFSSCSPIDPSCATAPSSIQINTTSSILEVDYKAVAADIAALVDRVPYRGPPLVRLAWHSSGTYDVGAASYTTPEVIVGGSSGGTIRFDEELAHEANAGLKQSAVRFLEPIKEKYGPGLSYADLYTLAGVVAIKALGGPSIDWSYGRLDSTDSFFVPPAGRLPSPDSGRPGVDIADARHLRSVFGRMGFTDREIVVLSGAHSIGRCNAWASGYDGTWTSNPVVFDNSYFINLANQNWKKRDWDGPVQYSSPAKPRENENTKGIRPQQQSLMMLPTDMVLVRDPSFRKYVIQYANDDGFLFERDFADAFQKLLELGTQELTPANNLWN